MAEINKKLRQYIPSKEKIIEHKSMRIFGRLLHAEYLWQFSLHGVARGAAIGAFCAWIPLPFHTLISVFIAIVFRANIPIAAALVWLANPITMPAFYYTAYKIGAALWHTPKKNLAIHFTVHALESTLAQIWQPFILGCFICGVICSVLAYMCAKLLWRKVNQTTSSSSSN